MLLFKNQMCTVKGVADVVVGACVGGSVACGVISVTNMVKSSDLSLKKKKRKVCKKLSKRYAKISLTLSLIGFGVSVAEYFIYKN